MESIAEPVFISMLFSFIKSQTSGKSSDNEWQRLITSGKMSDNEWQRVV